MGEGEITDGKIDFDVAGKPAPIVGNDVLIYYSKIERNLAGQRVKGTRFGRRAGRDPVTDPAIPPAGADGIFFNADDPITELEITTRDAVGHETLEVEYNGPGPDNNWATEADNVVDEYEVTTYVDGIRVAEQEYDAVDGIKDNGNDLLTEESTFNPAL